MPTYVEMACPKCQKVLRVRTEYLGQRVVCRHCQDGFKVSLEGVSARLATLSADLQQAHPPWAAKVGEQLLNEVEVPTDGSQNLMRTEQPVLGAELWERAGEVIGNLAGMDYRNDRRSS